MKKYIKTYFVLLILPFLIASCLNKEEFIVNPNLQSVSNLQSALVGDSVKLTWTLPVSNTPLKVMMSSDTQTFVQLPANSTSVTWGIVEVNKPYVLTIKVADDNGNTSLGQSVLFTREGTNPVENLDAKRNSTDIEVTWTLPQQNTATGIELTYDNQVVTLPATATSYRILNVISDKRYVIKVRTKSATLTSHYVTKVVNSLNFAFLTTFESLAALQANGDDDEIAAANWFVATYPNGTILPAAKVKDGSVDLKLFSVIWIPIDRVGSGAVPDEIKNDNLISRLTAYYKNGGNLLLTTHATQLIVDLGRTTRVPGIRGAGTGGSGSDTWSINPNIGEIYNHLSDPVFAGATSSTEYFPNSGATIPLIGPGHREDHNSMWDLNAYGYNIPADGANVVKAFVTENTAVVLATWGHVTDFCCAGMVYFAPAGEYQGKCYAIGLAAYEWRQNSNTNLHQANIEKITKNAFDLLK